MKKYTYSPIRPWPVFYVNSTHVCLPAWVIVVVLAALAYVLVK